MRKDGVIWTRILEIHRFKDLQGNTLSYTIGHTDKYGSYLVSDWLEKECVPDFEGPTAWGEVQRYSAKPWARHRVLRLVDPPTH